MANANRSTGAGTGLQDTAGEVVDEATRTAEARAASVLDTAQQSLHEVAAAVHRTSEGLRTDQPRLADFGDMAADRLEEAAGFLAEREPRELIDSAGRFAERQPALVIGGGLVLGFALGRLLRTADGGGTGARDGDWYRQGYVSTGSGGGYGYGTGYGADYGADANGDVAGRGAPGTSSRTSRTRSTSTVSTPGADVVAEG